MLKMQSLCFQNCPATYRQTKHFHCSLPFPKLSEDRWKRYGQTCLFLLRDHLQSNSVDKSLHANCNGLQLCLFSVKSAIVWSDGGGKETKLREFDSSRIWSDHVSSAAGCHQEQLLSHLILTSSLSCKPFVRILKSSPVDMSLL